ncbi:MAG: hypothetical protein EA406_00725 [Rhodospirillales bacterium]|nr:MAG: hypothetical protein EA406_00725 [Rhodospirillales bacterium]
MIVTWTVLLDGLLAVLLAVTIGYAVMLNRRLAAIRGGSEFDRHAAGFRDAVSRAEDSVARLKANADELQQRLEQARALQDDLSLLIDRGERVADGLETTVRIARSQQDSVRDGRRETTRQSGPDPVRAAAGPAVAGPVSGRGENAIASVRGRGQSGPATVNGKGRGATPSPQPVPRSQAERELLAALASRK